MHEPNKQLRLRNGYLAFGVFSLFLAVDGTFSGEALERLGRVTLPRHRTEAVLVVNRNVVWPVYYRKGSRENSRNSHVADLHVRASEETRG